MCLRPTTLPTSGMREFHHEERVRIGGHDRDRERAAVELRMREVPDNRGSVTRRAPAASGTTCSSTLPSVKWSRSITVVAGCENLPTSTSTLMSPRRLLPATIQAGPATSEAMFTCPSDAGDCHHATFAAVLHHVARSTTIPAPLVDTTSVANDVAASAASSLATRIEMRLRAGAPCVRTMATASGRT